MWNTEFVSPFPTGFRCPGFSKTKGQEWLGVRMSEVIMSEVKMSEVIMSKVKLSEVIMSEVKMSEVNMPEVKMSELKMSDVIMSEINVRDNRVSVFFLKSYTGNNARIYNC